MIIITSKIFKKIDDDDDNNYFKKFKGIGGNNYIKIIQKKISMTFKGIGGNN